jgi:antitoxin component HigA of HigAB toxin-antitoxin module
MRQLIDSQDADVIWVAKENLKKNRLVRKFPNEVAAIRKLLDQRTLTKAT